MMEASKSVCTDLRDWKLSIFDDWAAYFCIFKDLALYITSSNKSTYKNGIIKSKLH